MTLLGRRVRRASSVAAATVALGATVLGAACGSNVPSGSPVTAPTTSPVASTSAPTTPAPATPMPSQGPLASGLARADQALLAVTPAASIGLTLTYDAETTAAEIADPSLDPNVAALATGIAMASGAVGSGASASGPPASAASSSGGEDLVIVNVVRLRDPSVDDTWFRGWRDSYDRAACEPAGGVIGHSEATINGHDVFVGTCAGGAFTYHLRISGGGVIVSLTSIGLDRLGERIIRAIPAS